MDIIVDVGNGYKLPDVRATIEGLPAFCALRAQVAVKNSHYTGPPSQTIDFHTPEGGKNHTIRLTAFVCPKIFFTYIELSNPKKSSPCIERSEETPPKVIFNVSLWLEPPFC